MRTTSRQGPLAAIMLAAMLMAAPKPVAANDTSDPPFLPQTGTPKVEPGKTSKPKVKKKSTKTKKEDKKSEHEFRAGYHHAHNLIFRRHDFAGGITALRALGYDKHPDVATLIGYASRKLGRYDEAKYWYDKALAADPNNERTLSYYGMWHAEQGNRLKAEDYLAKVRSICGNTSCRAYAELKAVIAGTRTY